MGTELFEDDIRPRVFAWLERMVEKHGEVLPRTLLLHGVDVGASRIPLISQQGIFKPRALDLPISITTSPKGPYHDAFSSGGFLRYKYRGTDPRHPDNAGLRLAMQRRVPLVYFHGLVPGRYLAEWPVYIVEDDPDRLTFTVQFDEPASLAGSPEQFEDPEEEYRRKYTTASVRRRVHQHRFRERVLLAYTQCCALCRLKHDNLLDAAHIVPDREEGGEPVVANGLSLCKLHHAAFDKFILGIRPDLVVEIRRDVLEEIDGPMLRHGLQEMHGRRVVVIPSQRIHQPDPVRLEQRYEQFRNAS